MTEYEQQQEAIFEGRLDRKWEKRMFKTLCPECGTPGQSSQLKSFCSECAVMRNKNVTNTSVPIEMARRTLEDVEDNLHAIFQAVVDVTDTVKALIVGGAQRVSGIKAFEYEVLLEIPYPSLVYFAYSIGPDGPQCVVTERWIHGDEVWPIGQKQLNYSKDGR